MQELRFPRSAKPGQPPELPQHRDVVDRPGQNVALQQIDFTRGNSKIRMSKDALQSKPGVRFGEIKLLPDRRKDLSSAFQCADIGGCARDSPSYELSRPPAYLRSPARLDNLSRARSG